MGYIIVTGIITLILLVLILVANAKYKKVDYSKYEGIVMSTKVLFIGKFIIDDLTKGAAYKIESGNYKKCREDYIKLFGYRDSEDYTRVHFYSKYSLAVLALFIFSFFGLISSFQTYQEVGKEKAVFEAIIDRPEYDGSPVVKDYVAMMEYDGEEYEKRVKVTVPTLQPSEEEQKMNLDEAIKRIDEYVLGDNESFDRIKDNLNLYEEDNPYNATLEWVTEPADIIDNDGSIRFDLLEEPETEGLVKAIVTVGEVSQEVQKKIKIIKLNPLTLVGIIEKDLNVALTDEANSNKVKYELPTTMVSQNEEIPIKWDAYEEDVNYRNSGVFLFFGFVLALLFFKMTDDKLNEKLQNKQKEMQVQFPVFADKFILLYSCGISPSEAIKIYLNTQKSNSASLNHLDRELEQLLEQVEFSGQAIDDAILTFGKRSRVPDILKFTTLIAQDIRKGDKNMVESITKLIREAWEERKKIILERGIKASTKLLLPMMLMLVFVIVIVMAPAINSFNSF